MKIQHGNASAILASMREQTAHEKKVAMHQAEQAEREPDEPIMEMNEWHKPNEKMPEDGQVIKAANKEHTAPITNGISRVSTNSMIIDEERFRTTAKMVNPESAEITTAKVNLATATQVGGSHYKDMAIQPIEFITKNNLGFCEGNVIKYVCRHRSKNGKQDLEKAIHYLRLLIEEEYENKI